MANGPNLLSGRVPVVPLDQLTADRYQFLALGQAEPNLGNGVANSILTIQSNGNRVWANSVVLTTGAFSGNVTAANFVGNVSGNLVAPGSNTQVLFNDSGLISGNAALTFNKATTLLTVTGDSIITGNLTVQGNVNYINVTNLNIQDPIVGIGRGANNTPLATNDGKDRGEQLWYYTASEKSAFIGYDNSAANIILATDVTIANEIVTVNSYGNITVGNVSGQFIVASANINANNFVASSNILATGNVLGSYILGNGAFLTGIDTTLISSGTSNVRVTTAGGNIAANVGGVANVFVITSTGVNVTGTLGITSNITGGNLTTTGTANIGTLAVTGAAAITGNTTVTANIAGGNITTAGLITATGNITGGNLTTTGTANIGTLAVTGNATVVANIAGGNITTAGLITATGNITGGNLATLGTANIATLEVTVLANIKSTTAATSTTSGALRTAGGAGIVGNAYIGGLVTATGNVTGGNLTTTGTANIGTLAVTGTAAITGNTTVTANITGGNLTTTGTANIGTLAVTGNATITGTAAITGNTTVTANISGGNITTAGLITATGNVTGGNLITTGTANVGTLEVITLANIKATTAATSTTSGALKTAGGLGVVGNAYIGGLITATGNVTGGNLTTTGTANIGTLAVIGTAAITGNATVTANITGGNLITTGTANIGTLAVTGNATVVANIAGGNITTAGLISATGNITGGNLVTAGRANITGNVNGNNLIAAANVEILGNKITTGTTTGLLFAPGNVSLTSGNLIVNGGYIYSQNGDTAIVLVNNGEIGSIGIQNNLQVGKDGAGNLDVAGYANLTSDVSVGGQITVTGNVSGANVNTAGLISATGNITGGNLITSGRVVATGNINTTANIVAANVVTANINSSGGILITTSGNNNIELNPGGTGNIVVDNTYINGLVDPVQDQDAATKIYVDNLVTTGISYHEPVVAATISNLAVATSGTITYAQPNGVANGIGATITTTGSFNLIDTANIQTVGIRVLVKNEGNAVLNGVYTWANSLTIVRSVDADQYGSNSAEAFGINDYFYVQSGNVNAGSSWVVNSPTGTITFGTSNITFAEFSQAQLYGGGNGIDINGSVISAKVDNNTTAFDGTGNIIVKAGANLTTPNIGAATGVSLTTTGNITANNISANSFLAATTINATANITGGNIISNGVAVITGNASAGNLLVTGVANVSGNLHAFGNAHFGQDLSFAAAYGNIQYAGSANSYVQLVAQNKDNGSAASTDFVATADNGTDTDTYIDMGINSSGYSQAGFGLQRANDGYLYVAGNTATGGGNLVLSTFENNDIIFSTGGADTGDEQGRFQYGNGFKVTGNIYSTGNVRALNFIGNLIGNVTGNLNVTGPNTGVVFNDGGAGNSTAGFTFDKTSNLVTSSGNITAIGNVSGNFILGNGYYLTGIITSVANINNGNSNVSIPVTNGNVTIGVSGVANVVVISSNTLTVTGNIESNSGYFLGNGVYLTGVVAASSNSTGVTNINYGASNVRIDTPGGNISANVGGTANVFVITSAGANVTGNLGVSSNVSANYFLGNGACLTGVITSVANINNGTSNISIPVASGNINASVGGVANVFVITSAGANITGNLDVSSNVSAAWFLGNANATSLTSGTVPSSRLTGTYSISISGLAATANTVTDAAQPNITSVGTLSSLTATGNVTGGNLTTAGLISATGNVTGGNLTTTGLISATGNVTGGNLTTAGISNVGTLSVTGSGNVTGNLGVAGNVSASYFLGNGSLLTGVVTAVGNSIANGTSSVNIPMANGNVNTSVGGTANVLVVTGTGANVAGTLDATGNITSGNLNTGGLVSATGNITGGNITTAGQIISTNAGSATTGAGQLYLNGGTLNRIDWNTNGTGAPAFTTRSVGTKTTLYPSLGDSTVDYALGVEAGALWSSIPGADGGQFFKWYGGTTQLASLSGAGVFLATGNVTGSNLTTAGIANIGTLLVTGDGLISGNLTVNGNTNYVNVTNLNIQDPIIGIGRGANNAPLTTNDNKDRGEQLWYYSDSEKSSFIGYDNSAGNLIAAIDVSISSEVVTVNSYGNFVVGTLAATTVNATGNITATGNVTGGNIITAGLISATGNVSGGNILGNGYYLSGIATLASVYYQLQVQGNVTGNSAGNATLTASNSSGILYPRAGNGITMSGNATTNVLTITVSGSTNDGTLWGNGGDCGLITDATTPPNYDNGLVDEAVVDAYDLGILLQSAPGGANGSIQFNYNNQNFGGAENFTWSSNTANLYVGGNATFTGSQTVGGNATVTGSQTVTGNITGGNLTTAGVLTVNSGNAVSAIVNGGPNAVGNIGSSSKYFNTVFAKSTSALYADLAEIYDTDIEYQPGTVMIIGGTKQLTQSTMSHDSKVVGVISDKPAYLMNTGVDGQPLALTGKVRCLIKDSVKRGDLLVSSDMPGYAQVLDPALYQVGCVFGKSLEDFDGDTGEIWILVGRY
jgi:hypothetical protein